MDAQFKDPAHEIKLLQRCISDLITVLALPAAWSGNEPSQIVSSLIDALLRLLGLDLVYVRVKGPVGERAIEMVRTAPSQRLIPRPEEIHAAIGGWLGENPTMWPSPVRKSLGDGNISLFPLRLGLQAEIGFIVAGSVRTNFPGEMEKLVLTVAANQAAVGLQEARLLSQQKQLANELDEQVAQRTQELAEAHTQVLRSEANMRRLVEANVVGIVVFDLTGAITGANQAFCRMVQYDREDVASGRVRWTDLTPDEWRESDENALAELRASRTFQPYEKEYLRKDGSRVPVLLGGTLFEGADAEGVAFVLDLTRQKGEESARGYSEERHRVVAETASDAIISVDDTGLIVFANPATATIFGHDPVELLGKPLTLLMPEYMRELHRNGFKRYLTTGKRHVNWQGIELMGLRKNGEEFPTEISFGELNRDGHKVFTGILRDISKRKQAEQALRRSEAFLSEGQRLGKIGCYSWRVATNEITWSEQLYRIFEFEIGVSVTAEMIRNRVHPEDVSLYEKMVEDARTGGNDFEWQYRLLMPDHSTKYLHAVARATRDQDGRLEYIAAIQDVTDRRLSQEALDRARSELAHVARVMTLGTLTASISHEIRQPITAAVTDAKTCARWLNRDEPDLAEAQEAISRLVKDLTRASEIISRISSLFKKEAPKRELVNVNEVAEEMIVLLRGEARTHSISIQHDLARDLPRIAADRVQIQQVLMNLILNAIDAMKGLNTSKMLTIRSRREESGQVLISVSDTGLGLPPEQTERIFAAFFTSKAQGTGMGLTISRSIIESHGGRLWATSHSGPGATFHFTLPIEDDEQQAA